MGLILDSSLLIAAEREGSNAGQVLSEIAGRAAGEDVAFSVVMLIELAHGAARADTAERKTMRRRFLQELTTALPVHPVTVPALELGYRVATANVRHFQMIPGLEIVPL